MTNSKRGRRKSENERKSRKKVCDGRAGFSQRWLEQMVSTFCTSFVNDFKIYLSIPKRSLESPSACLFSSLFYNRFHPLILQRCKWRRRGGCLEEERERERQKTEKEGASIIKNVILPLLNISRELQAEALQSE